MSAETSSTDMSRMAAATSIAAKSTSTAGLLSPMVCKACVCTATGSGALGTSTTGACSEAPLAETALVAYTPGCVVLCVWEMCVWQACVCASTSAAYRRCQQTTNAAVIMCHSAAHTTATPCMQQQRRSGALVKLKGNGQRRQQYGGGARVLQQGRSHAGRRHYSQGSGELTSGSSTEPFARCIWECLQGLHCLLLHTRRNGALGGRRMCKIKGTDVYSRRCIFVAVYALVCCNTCVFGDCYRTHGYGQHMVMVNTWSNPPGCPCVASCAESRASPLLPHSPRHPAPPTSAAARTAACKGPAWSHSPAAATLPLGKRGLLVGMRCAPQRCRTNALKPHIVCHLPHNHHHVATCPCPRHVHCLIVQPRTHVVVTHVVVTPAVSASRTAGRG